MKKLPLILTILSTSLIWSSAQNAMEGRDHVVLDKRLDPTGKPQILVLTETGREKAMSLQRYYDEQREREHALPRHEASEDDPELAEAIRLSLENQTLGLTNPTSAAISKDPEFEEAMRLSLKDQTPVLITRSTLPIAKEEGDWLLNHVLSESAREYEEQQKKMAEEKEALEKERLNMRRDQVRKALKEEMELRSAQKKSIFSKMDQLKEQEWLIRNKFISLFSDSQLSTASLIENLQLQDKEIKEIEDQIRPLENEISLFEEIENLIHEEIIYLIRGGDPRVLPWMQNLTNPPIPQSEAGENSSLPPIPSSALPHFNSGGLTNK